MKRITLFTLFFIFLHNLLFANITFPKLTGRVVDQAQILSSEQKKQLSSILETHEKETSNQIVIVTLNSLKGQDIADYGYQLGRYWQIGQKDKNNGVLLIISMAEKKLRIEVGYGLEGALTDKISHEIIEYILKPAFRQNDFYGGIQKAVQAIIKTIKGEYKPSDYGVLEDDSLKWFFIFFAMTFLSTILVTTTKKLKYLTLRRFFFSIFLASFASTFVIGFTQSLFLAIILFLIITVIVFINAKKITFEPNINPHLSYGSHYSDFEGFSSGRGSGGFSGGSGGFSGGGGSFGGGGASGGW